MAKVCSISAPLGLCRGHSRDQVDYPLLCVNDPSGEGMFRCSLHQYMVSLNSSCVCSPPTPRNSARDEHPGSDPCCAHSSTFAAKAFKAATAVWQGGLVPAGTVLTWSL
uniref:Uncharacterized protein n=1 Tax=Tetradesmus obliquus TaxID=3088 RepID=A0A383VY55_TETOB|eukprot:jgi/Sobl393_1/16803/SZX69773.1